jgi:hypothetical protein
MATRADIGRMRERSTTTYTATLKDSAGVVIPLANLTTLILTLKDEATETVINSRNAQNVLNANNVTYHTTSGLLTWSIQAADNPISGTRKDALERHTATFEFTFNAGANRDWHEVTWLVEGSGSVS